MGKNDCSNMNVVSAVLSVCPYERILFLSMERYLKEAVNPSRGLTNIVFPFLVTCRMTSWNSQLTCSAVRVLDPRV